MLWAPLAKSLEMNGNRLTKQTYSRKMGRFGELILLLLRYPFQCLRAARLP